MKRFNKGTAAALSGAVVTLAGGFFALDADVQGSLATLLTTLLVILIPNKG